MSTNPAQLLVWTGAEHACVRVAGRATFAVSVDFRKVLHRLREAGFRHVLLDLSGCQAMDSTFLGVLAQQAASASTASAPPAHCHLELLNTPRSVRQTMEDLGVAPCFQFTERDLRGQDFQPASGDRPASREELTRTSLEAHEALMALHPANVGRFKDVARFLADELAASREPKPSPES